LEEIIFLLPDLIHQRWQYNSILDVLKRLLHPGNSLNTRVRGTEIFLLWFQDRVLKILKNSKISENISL